jgi:aminoglycoside 6-adenylyltransferase
VTLPDPAAADRMLERILQWGAADPVVRGLALTGSRAGPAPPDALADLDVQVYARPVARLEETDGWLEALGAVWVRVRDEYQDGGARIKTRLVIYDSGTKVDFSLHDARAMSERVGGSFPVHVLLDKDGVTTGAPARTARPARGREEYTAMTQEFWFEAYHVSKYLARGDLWPARARQEALLARLLPMLEWRYELVRGAPPPADGKALTSWAPEVASRMADLYPRPDVAASWRVLFETLDLFREVAREVAAAAGLPYDSAADRLITAFLVGLRDGSGEAPRGTR